MTTSADGITLLGSEMLTWSDADGARGAFGGLLAPQLLHDFGGPRERALVAGPTTSAVIRDVADHFTAADVLVRSWLDAQRLRQELPAEIGVLCGPLDRLTRTGATYDAVVAVAGLDRLHSAEEETPAVETVVADLAGLVGPEGELFLGVGNPVGVDHLLSLADRSRHADADWPDGHLVEQRALDAAGITVLLEQGHGLTVVETWCCHGRRSDPLVAAPAGLLSSARDEVVLLREVARAYDVADPSAPALKDPQTTVRGLVAAGLGAAVAPLTMLHLRRGVLGAPAPADAVLVHEPADGDAPALAYRLTRTANGWERTLLGEATAARVAPGLVRDPVALSGPVPAGVSLADALEDCCAAHDVTAAGALVRRFGDWLGVGPESTVPVDRVALLPRQLAVADELVPLDRSRTADETAPRDVVLLRGLLDVAADLLARGIRHPWSAAASPWTLAASLATAAGIEDAEALRDQVLALDARLRPAGSAADYDAAAATARLSYAELAEVADALATRAAEADEHVLWLLRRVQGRQRAFRKARGELNALNSSREVRIGRKVFWLRDKLRRRPLARAAGTNAATGEWQDRSGEERVEEPLEVEQQLMPPGYVPPAEVTVLPPEEDGSEQVP